MGRLQGAEQLPVGIGPISAQSDRSRHALFVGRDLGVVRHMGDLASGIDGTAAVDLHAAVGAIGHPGADHEVERRCPPHPVRKADLRQLRQVELGRADVGGALLPLQSELDRQLGFRFEDQRRPGSQRLDANSEPARQSDAVDTPPFGGLADGSGRQRFAVAAIDDLAGGDVDRDLVAFLERPAARPLRR